MIQPGFSADISAFEQFTLDQFIYSSDYRENTVVKILIGHNIIYLATRSSSNSTINFIHLKIK